MERKFSNALRTEAQQGRIPIIVDVKVYSPLYGDLFRGRTHPELALTFKNAGAPAFAVITEKENYHGSLDALGQVAAISGLPVLRKDFITEVKELEDTVRAGASAVLLICSMHSPERLKKLFLAAHELGLEVLVETHTAQELEVAAALGAKLIGINNKDIGRLEMDDGNVNKMLTLISQAPADALIVNESGLRTREDVCAAIDAGADALLIGSALLQADDPAQYYEVLSKGR
ncbi:MAG: indole-3-glycerol-phosphate synthase [Thermoclostridium sp.]|nr:indole-3-glycerol-phosphate synthase [Thermoclostridium sp.]